jgi:hypothetical protein
MVSGEKCLVAWNGSDFVKVVSSVVPPSGVLPIANGGTNASSAATALSNLGGVTTGKSIAMALIFGF